MTSVYTLWAGAPVAEDRESDVRDVLGAHLDRAGQWSAVDTNDYLRVLNDLRSADLADGEAQLDEPLAEHVRVGLQVLDYLPHRFIRQTLARAVCDAAALASWRALDGGRLLAAWDLGRRAEVAGRECDRIEMWAYACAQRADILHEVGRDEEALTVVQEAVDAVIDEDSSQVFNAWLYSQLGQAYAHTGHGSQSMAAFDSADWFLGSDDTAAPSDPELPFLFHIGPSHLMRWRGHALMSLGDEAALDVLESTEQAFASYPRGNVSLQVDLARAHLQHGNRGQAQHYASGAAEASERIGSVRTLRRALSILHQLGD